MQIWCLVWHEIVFPPVQVPFITDTDYKLTKLQTKFDVRMVSVTSIRVTEPWKNVIYKVCH